MIDAEDLPTISLTDEQKARIKGVSTLSEFHKKRLEADQKRNWDRFYKRNGNRFFRSRYWTRREFEELFQENDEPAQSRNLLEVGCGCGDFVIPLIDDTINEQDVDNEADGRAHSIRLSLANRYKIYCCDISDVAIDIVKSNPAYLSQSQLGRISAFVADISSEHAITDILGHSNGNQMDAVSLIFVLSAMDLESMQKAVQNISHVIKRGGLVVFRDYAIYDQAMLRFKLESKINDQFYVRQDGTRAFFLTKRQLLDLFCSNGFECVSIDYIKRETLNRATQDKFCRVFLQAKFTRL